MELTGSNLDLEKVKQIVTGFETVTISKESLEEVKKSRKAVEDYLDQHQVIYGINTGFGKFSDVEIEDGDLDELQLNLIHSHACGVGEPFSEQVSRAMILLRANALLKGYSGVRPVIIERLIDLLNHRIHPVIPQQGSLGASGDLAPLAHLALVLLGEGEVYYQGEQVPTMIAFNQEKLEPVQLKAKEGLALINGTQAMTAVGVLAYLDAEKVLTYSEKLPP